MPSFDIVSKTDMAEVANAISGMQREIATRFDFKGSKSTVELKDGTVTLNADDELKLKQMHELLKQYLTRRKVDAGALDFKPAEKASGSALRQTVVVRQGVEQEIAKRIVKEIKGTKLKVQVSIQGDALRVTGKKRDELQEAIAFVRGLKIDMPLQYVNFRD
jgi:uncharacterized protein YajQ (UPF0234 family)